MKMTTDIPQQLITPDTAHTCLGTLKFFERHAGRRYYVRSMTTSISKHPLGPSPVAQDDELKENPGKWYQIIAFYQIAGMIDARLCAPRSLKTFKRPLSPLPESKGDARPSQKGYLVTPTPQKKANHKVHEGLTRRARRKFPSAVSLAEC
jgi:hypothetical protein